MEFPPLAAAFTLWGQQFEWNDLAIVGLLVLLEGVLSIDNALVLGLLAKRLPKSQQKKALTYGLVGAFVFRLIAIGMASKLLEWRIVKLFGGGYLVYIAVKHLFFESKEEFEEKLTVDPEGQPVLVDPQGQPLTEEQERLEIEERVPVDLAGALGEGQSPAPSPADKSPDEGGGKAKFWPTVFTIEMTDLAFAVDSILAAIALVGSPPPDHPKGALHPKLWVVYAGGMLGVILMRYAAAVFIKLLEKFPRFELSAYLLVIVIGLKLLADWGINSVEHPHRLNFHDLSRIEFWVFWILMAVCFGIGFLKPRSRNKGATPPAAT